MDAVDFGTGVGCQVCNFGGLQQVGECWVGIFAVVVVVEVCEWWISERDVSYVVV